MKNNGIQKNISADESKTTSNVLSSAKTWQK